MNRQDSRIFRLSRRLVTAFFVACLPLSGLLTGCSGFDNVTIGEGEEAEQRGVAPADRLREGMADYDVGKYGSAVKKFTALLEEHPFSREAMLAQLKLADAYYYERKYDEAREQYKAFETRYPTNEAIPYVLFQQGMCDYSRVDRIDRDPGSVNKAIASFTRLLNAAPNSPYSQEATRKIKDAQEFLAHHEFLVADFYIRTNKDDSAKQRLRYLLSTYPESDMALRAKTLLAELEGKTAGKAADAAAGSGEVLDAGGVEADLRGEN